MRHFLGTMSREEGVQVIVQKGAKRVPPTKNSNAKEGCNLIVTMDMDSSQLLMPQTIFIGKSFRFVMNDLVCKN